MLWAKSYLAGPPLRFVFSSMPLEKTLLVPVVEHFPIVNNNRELKALISSFRSSWPAGLLGR